MQPNMDSDGLDFFKNQIIQSHCYLEYGCGGSTVYANNTSNVKTIISVDTDLHYINKVKNIITTPIDNLHLCHVNLGEVADWGHPKTTLHYKDFYKYSTMPWQIAKKINAIPDLIFIDGRFRVSCFLYSLVCASIDTIIMFDDYVNRSNYHIVEEFCKLNKYAGRLGIFVVKKNYSFADLMSVYSEYLSDTA